MHSDSGVAGGQRRELHYQLNLHLLLLGLSGLQEEKEEGGWLLHAAGVLESERRWWRSTTGPAAPPLP